MHEIRPLRIANDYRPAARQTELFISTNKISIAQKG